MPSRTAPGIGGWAAKELCENGLKPLQLVLERGPMVKHVEDYPTAHLDPWDMPDGGRATQEIIDRKPKQHRTGHTTQVAREHFFVAIDDLKHPHNEINASIGLEVTRLVVDLQMWGRQSYRSSDIDFGCAAPSWARAAADEAKAARMALLGVSATGV